MAERSKAPDSKNFPMSLLYSNVCVGSNTTPVEFCVQKPTFCSKQFLWESNEEQDEEEFTLQEIDIAIRQKRLRYTISEGRMAGRSKAPDSWEIQN